MRLHLLLTVVEVLDFVWIVGSPNSPERHQARPQNIENRLRRKFILTLKFSPRFDGIFGAINLRSPDVS